MPRYIFKNGNVYVEEVKLGLTPDDLKPSFEHNSVVLILTESLTNNPRSSTSIQSGEFVTEFTIEDIVVPQKAS